MTSANLAAVWKANGPAQRDPSVQDTQMWTHPTAISLVSVDESKEEVIFDS